MNRFINKTLLALMLTTGCGYTSYNPGDDSRVHRSLSLQTNQGRFNANADFGFSDKYNQEYDIYPVPAEGCCGTYAIRTLAREVVGVATPDLRGVIQNFAQDGNSAARLEDGDFGRFQQNRVLSFAPGGYLENRHPCVLNVTDGTYDDGGLEGENRADYFIWMDGRHYSIAVPKNGPENDHIWGRNIGAATNLINGELDVGQACVRDLLTNWGSNEGEVGAIKASQRACEDNATFALLNSPVMGLKQDFFAKVYGYCHGVTTYDGARVVPVVVPASSSSSSSSSSSARDDNAQTSRTVVRPTIPSTGETRNLIDNAWNTLNTVGPQMKTETDPGRLKALEADWDRAMQVLYAAERQSVTKNKGVPSASSSSSSSPSSVAPAGGSDFRYEALYEAAPARFRYQTALDSLNRQLTRYEGAPEDRKERFRDKIKIHKKSIEIVKNAAIEIFKIEEKLGENTPEARQAVAPWNKKALEAIEMASRR